MSDSLLKKLEEWEALAAKATKGPWIHDKMPAYHVVLLDDIKFIAASREAVPALCAALREAVDILQEVAQMRVSYYAGPLTDGHETEPIEVETRETLQSRKARAFLARWEGK